MLHISSTRARHRKISNLCFSMEICITNFWFFVRLLNIVIAFKLSKNEIGTDNILIVIWGHKMAEHQIYLYLQNEALCSYSHSEAFLSFLFTSNHKTYRPIL